MSLMQRYLLLCLLLIPLTAATLWQAASRLSEKVTEDWALRYAEKQVLYDRQRTLQPIKRELSLARQFAASESLQRFALNPDDSTLRAQALQEMENYRFSFQEMNYFVALYRSGEYFHNDANNTYQGRQLRYRLNRENPDDAWFYQQIDQQRSLHINVNYDAELQVTKLWVDILLRHQGEILGIVGTGLNLDGLLRRISSERDTGVRTLLTDHTGAIQLHHDRSLINYSSFTRPAADLHTAEQLLTEAADRQWLARVLAQGDLQPERIFSRYVSVDSSRQLMAVAYLPEIDWFSITLFDTKSLLPPSRYSEVVLTYLAGLLALLIPGYLLIRRQILQPAARLRQAIRQLKDGQVPDKPLQVRGELGELMQEFQAMADKVSLQQQQLEQQVAERTEALERATRTDGMTGLLNRRGMMQELQQKFQQPGRKFSLLWLDLDFFKEINDRYGHVQGDQALIAVSKILQQQVTRSGLGTCARWGGDELLACIDNRQAVDVLNLCENIRLEIERFRPGYAESGQPAIPLTVSIGAYNVSDEDSLTEAVHFADAALYQAKAEGRNTVRLYNEPRLRAVPFPA